MTDQLALQRRITDVVALVPGVDTVFAVSQAGDGLTVLPRESTNVSLTVTIGVDDAAGATEVCRLVYDAVIDELLLAGEMPGSVTVKVASIG